MNRGMLHSLVNVSLVAGVVLAVSDVIAQQAPTTTTSTFVTTQCGFGQVTVCGTEPVGQICTYVFGATADKDGNFGFNFGGMKCTSGGTQNRYKDFNTNTATGTCVIVRRPPADNTGTRPPGDEEYPIDEGGGSC